MSHPMQPTQRRTPKRSKMAVEITRLTSTKYPPLRIRGKTQFILSIQINNFFQYLPNIILFGNPRYCADIVLKFLKENCIFETSRVMNHKILKEHDRIFKLYLLCV